MARVDTPLTVVGRGLASGVYGIVGLGVAGACARLDSTKG